jgi:hypothetical protein
MDRQRRGRGADRLTSQWLTLTVEFLRRFERGISMAVPPTSPVEICHGLFRRDGTFRGRCTANEPLRALHPSIKRGGHRLHELRTHPQRYVLWTKSDCDRVFTMIINPIDFAKKFIFIF